MKIDSKNKKIVIFSDVHNDYNRVKEIVKHEDADYNVCLGDWFDSFYYDSPGNYLDTAKYLMEYVDSDKNITLWGNHDTHYIADNPSTICSGYEDWKYLEIDEALGNFRGRIRNKFKWFLRIDDWLCTHAGLHSSHLPHSVKTNDDIDEYLNSQIEIANIKLNTKEHHWFWAAGRARGGYARFGGITWLDFDYEFDPIDVTRQIVGHTPRRPHQIQCHKSEGFLEAIDGNNICIDTSLSQYLTISNGKMEVKYYSDL